MREKQAIMVNEETAEWAFISSFGTERERVPGSSGFACRMLENKMIAQREKLGYNDTCMRTAGRRGVRRPVLTKG